MSKLPLRALAFAAALLMLLYSSAALMADNGPHGGYTPATDACAGCHRAHTAPAARLLTDIVPGLCSSCHGSGGNGADTNVMDGLYLERDGGLESPAEGVANQGLKGGGFQQALMDTDADIATAAVVLSTSSSHLFDGSTGTVWGNGAIGSGAGSSAFSLSCTSCHDPHGGGSYRSLRDIPTGSGAAAPVTVTDETNKLYTVADAGSTYIGETYGPRGTQLAAWCSQCHTRYLAGSGSGHTDSGDPIFAFRHESTSVNCVQCHVAHGSSADTNGAAGVVEWPDSATAPNGSGRSSLLRLNNRGVCAYCHVDGSGAVSGGACDLCHGAPPATGSHAAHAGSGAVGYGLTGSFASSTNYQFGCGECHPTDPAQHQNGTVDTQLSSTGAPAGSLKSQNSAAAAFSGGSCGSVYCHSGITLASGAVGSPLVDGGGNYILDAHMNPTYDPYTLTETRVYQTTPAWSGGTLSGCTACHPFPLTTSVPGVQAGVGGSHQWIGDFGYGNLHAYNMSFDPVSCRTCHYGEITAANTWSRDAMDITTYDPVPLASRVLHANGQRDVVFDTVNNADYNTSSGLVSHSLATAVYDPVNKSCTNVGCHLQQNYVEWGSPYRHWTAECDLCHRYGYFPIPPPINAPAVTQNQISVASAAHSGVDLQAQSCTSCHSKPHGGG